MPGTLLGAYLTKGSQDLLHKYYQHYIRWQNLSFKRSSNFLRVTWLGSKGAGIELENFLSSEPIFFSLLHSAPPSVILSSHGPEEKENMTFSFYRVCDMAGEEKYIFL